MRILVTGSTGQVGRAVAAHLRTNGHSVVGLSRNGPSEFDAEHAMIDIADPAAVELITAATEPCQAIVHAAASLDFGPDARSVSAVNCWGTQAMLAVARIWGAQAFVFVSTISVIGLPCYTPITEDHPAKPIRAYQASKLFGEYLTSIAADGGMNAMSLRLTAPVGAGTPKNRIMRVFVEKAARDEPLVLVGRGTRQQNFVDVRDVASAVELCLGSLPTGVMNIAGDRAVSNADLAKTCVRVLESSSTIGFAGDDEEEGLEWHVSIARAQSLIGFHPQHGIESSIRAIAAET
jgi:nucleoside-diphosphate-sugar epimerase